MGRDNDKTSLMPCDASLSAKMLRTAAERIDQLRGTPGTPLLKRPISCYINFVS